MVELYCKVWKGGDFFNIGKRQDPNCKMKWTNTLSRHSFGKKSQVIHKNDVFKW